MECALPIGHTAIVAMKPLALAGASGASMMHLIIAALSVVGLLLSLLGRGYRNALPAT